MTTTTWERPAWCKLNMYITFELSAARMPRWTPEEPKRHKTLHTWPLVLQPTQAQWPAETNTDELNKRNLDRWSRDTTTTSSCKDIFWKSSSSNIHHHLVLRWWSTCRWECVCIRILSTCCWVHHHALGFLYVTLLRTPIPQVPGGWCCLQYGVAVRHRPCRPAVRLPPAEVRWYLVES